MWQNTSVIARFAWTDPAMGPAWWDKRWTWCGGPNLRFGGALYQSKRILNSRSPGRPYTLMPCITLSVGLAITAVACGSSVLLSFSCEKHVTNSFIFGGSPGLHYRA